MKNKRVTKGERFIYLIASIAFGCTILFEFFLGANIGHLNISVEKLKYDINEQQRTNESLQMKVNELTAFDNVKDVAKNLGLAYNNDNIIVIGE